MLKSYQHLDYVCCSLIRKILAVAKIASEPKETFLERPFVILVGIPHRVEISKTLTQGFFIRVRKNHCFEF